MTRINLVPPAELATQHLFAEWREIKHVPKALARSINARGLDAVLERVPPSFVLGTGHVMFFYTRGAYLARRYALLMQELRRRGVNFDEASAFVWEHSDPRTMLDYVPTVEALSLVRARIAERIAARPDWYRW